MSRTTRDRRGTREGSVLVIVLWVAFGLVALGLYFAQSMTFELRAADNRVAGVEAEQAIDGAARYAAYVLSKVEDPGKLPESTTYQRQAVPVGEATFWFLGRPDDVATGGGRDPVFGLVDEAGKLNLNTATALMLEQLPRMTPELAAAIVDWRDSDSEVTGGGAEEETYSRRTPAHRCKNALFESVEELRWVAGMEFEILYGEDANRNGLLDANENDGDLSPPSDNRDGGLDPGLVDYVTVHSREPNVRSDGSARINVGNAQGRQQLATLLEEKLGADRGNAILQHLGPQQGQQAIRSVLEFYLRSGMTAAELDLLEADLTATNGTSVAGLVNVNTAPAAVLACLPGMDLTKAETMVARRRSNAGTQPSIAWVTEALDRETAIQIGPYVTSRSYQVTADIVAVGHHGRGYRRAAMVIDLSEETPAIRTREDLTQLGRAVDEVTWNQMRLAAARAGTGGGLLGTSLR